MAVRKAICPELSSISLFSIGPHSHLLLATGSRMQCFVPALRSSSKCNVLARVFIHPNLVIRPPPSSFQSIRRRHQHTSHLSEEPSRLPRLFRSSIWQSIIPRPLRTRSSAPRTKRPSNPANYFLWIYLLIGSQAIRILGIKNEHKTYMRKADLKIAKLREVVEKLQRGEEVDVEKVLGTGDQLAEQEWEDALREVVEEERVWTEKRRVAREEEERREANSPVDVGVEATVNEAAGQKMVPHAPGFY